MFRIPFAARRLRRAPHCYFRPKLEMLEERLTPASYSAVDLSKLPINGYDSIEAYLQNDKGEIIGQASKSTQQGTVYEIEVYTAANGWTNLSAPPVQHGFFPLGINNNGEILGSNLVGTVPSTGWDEWQLYTPNGTTFTSVMPNGEYVLTPPNPRDFTIASVDDAGEILAFVGSNSVYAQLYHNGTWGNLPSLPDTAVSAPFPLYMNHNGIILATEYQSAGSDNAYISKTADPDPNSTNAWDQLGAPPNAGLFVAGLINDNGQVAIQTQQNNIWINLTDQSTGWVEIAPKNLPDLQLWGFNNAGQVLVRASVGPNDPILPYLYSGGNWTDLSAASGESLETTRALNSNGQLLAQGTNNDTYLLTPLPPAATAAPPTNSSPSSPPAVTFQDDVSLLFDAIEFEVDQYLSLFLPGYAAGAAEIQAIAESSPAWNTSLGNLFWQFGLMLADQAISSNHHS